MKANKYTATLLAVSAVSIILLISDLSSYARGSKSFLLGSRSTHRESQPDFDDRLSKIGGEMASLLVRLSQIEQSVFKLNRDFERKAGREGHKDRHSERHAKISSRRSKKHDTIPSEDAYSIDIKGNTHVESPIDDILNRSMDNSTPGSKDISSKASLRNMAEQKPYVSGIDENGVDPDTEPSISRVEIRKVQVSVGPAGKSHKLLPGFKINMEDIFPDLNKEDPIVELKRFDDADSFKTFGNNMRTHKAQENDGSHSTFYKMSDIIGSPRSEPPSAKDAAKFSEIQHLPRPGLETIPQSKYLKNEDTLPAPREASKDPIRVSGGFKMIGMSANDAVLKTGDAKAADPFSLYDSIEDSKIAQRDELPDLKFHTILPNFSQVTEKRPKEEISDRGTGKKYCSEFENPAEAYKNGRCIWGEKNSSSPGSQAEELLKSMKHNGVVSSSREVLSQIKSSISDMEAQMKESKRIEDKIAEKAKSLGKSSGSREPRKVDSPMVPETSLKEMKDLEQQIKQARQDFLESEKSLLKSGVLEEDEIDKTIQKPTSQQAI